MKTVVSQKTESVESLLAALYRVPIKTRRAAMLAAARVINNKPDALLCSQAEAARLLGVSRCTVWRMVQDNTIHPVTIRGVARYRVTELEALAIGEVQP
jgi:excisionase family DNA binding protein